MTKEFEGHCIHLNVGGRDHREYRQYRRIFPEFSRLYFRPLLEELRYAASAFHKHKFDARNKT
jgi:hypothetical protein